MKNSTPQERSISDKAFTDGTPLENLRRLSAHGFNRLHFSTNWTSPSVMTEPEIEQWETDLAETGVRVLDVHGCHTNKGGQLWTEEEDAREQARELFRYRVNLTQRLGGDAMVIHVPTHIPDLPNHVANRFLDELARLEPFARERGVTIALENHYQPASDLRVLPAAFERFDPEYIGFTFDPGHALISGNMDWILENCMQRLSVLHLNDNDGQGDHHWLPLQPYGTADWSRIAQAIANSPYRKPLQFEVSWREDRHPRPDDFLQQAAEAYDQLHAHITDLRSHPE